MLAQIGLTSYDRRELVAKPHPVEKSWRAIAFQQRFGDRRAQTTQDGVFFNRHNSARFASGFDKSEFIQRLYRVNTQDAALNSLAGKLCAGCDGFVQDPAGSNQ